MPLGLDHPYWVDDADIDIDFHVRDLALPAPGDDRQLAEKAAQLVAQPLDHSRPLWELYLIEGLEGGRSALVFKLHHASVDGISGLDLHEMLFDSAPEGCKIPRAKRRTGEPVPSQWRMLARGGASLPAQGIGARGGGGGRPGQAGAPRACSPAPETGSCSREAGCELRRPFSTSRSPRTDDGRSYAYRSTRPRPSGAATRSR